MWLFKHPPLKCQLRSCMLTRWILGLAFNFSFHRSCRLRSGDWMLQAPFESLQLNQDRLSSQFHRLSFQQRKETSVFFSWKLSHWSSKFSWNYFSLFLATSNGEKPLLKTRKVSGKEGSCEKYHMKLHIYVCDSEKGKKHISAVHLRILKAGQTRLRVDQSWEAQAFL